MKLVTQLSLSFFAISLPALFACTTQHPDKTARPESYAELISSVQAGQTDIDYTKLRLAYTASSEYNPFNLGAKDMRYRSWNTFRQEKLAEALNLSEQLQKNSYIDIEAHMLCDLAYRQQGRLEKADFHRAVAKGLLQSIYASGDGATPEKAYQVISLDEEYAYLLANNLKMERQGLVRHGQHNYDVLRVISLESGMEKTIYFNIDLPWNRLSRDFEKSHP
jgi:hypothetical protein